MTETIIYQVTELSTHRDKFSNDYEEILYGADYVKHNFKTLAEAKAFEAKLNQQGITTNLTETHRVA